MKISYIANIRLPTEKAHGYQIMRVCSELSKLGSEVTIYVPDRRNFITQDAFVFYGLEKNFSLVYVPCFDWIRFDRLLGPLAFKLQMRAFLRTLSKQQISKDAVVYTRDAEVAKVFSDRGYATVYNAHNWPAQSAKMQKLLEGVRGVVANSGGTSKAVRKDISAPITTLYNASDPNPFVGKDKVELRAQLGLPADKYIALYAGHLYGWKGVKTVFDAAKQCPDMLFVCIGGTQGDVEKAKQQAVDIPNVLLLGHKPKTEVPKYLVAADVLLLPNTAATEESVRYTSPIKMFEYMASGTPIIASDLPSLREVLTEDIAFFVEAGDAAALADTLQYTKEHTEETKQKALQARVESASYTWEAHAKGVLDFLYKIQ